MDVRVVQPDLQLKTFPDKRKIYPFQYCAKEGLVEEMRASMHERDVNNLDENGLSALHYAARFNQVETAEYLLKIGANINLPGQDQITPLYSAAMFNGEEVFQLLLKKGADIELKNVHGFGVLHIASRRGHKTLVQYLMEDPTVQINVNELDNENWTPLHHACVRGHKEICEILIMSGASINVVTTDGSTSLHLATVHGSEEIVNLLLLSALQNKTLKKSDFVNLEDESMHSALHVAARDGHYQICELLLENGAKMQHTNSVSPLHYASVSGHVNIVELLLSKGAEVCSTDTENYTPLHRAAMFNQIEVVKVLISHGANVNTRTDTKRTPFISVILAGHLQMARLLIENGATAEDIDMYNKSSLHYAVESENLATVKHLLQLCHGMSSVDRVDKNDQTCLHYAAKLGLPEIVEELLKHTKNVGLKDVNEETALHLASKNGHFKTVEKLISATPGNCNEPDGCGKTPLYNAVCSGKRKLCAFLIEKGALVNVKDDTRQTPLHIAAKLGFPKIVELLLNNGSQIDAIDTAKNTALHIAASEGQADNVRLLLDKQANVTLKTSTGKTALDFAIDASEETARVILQHSRWKEVMSVRDENSHTPLKKLIAVFPEGAEIVMNNSIDVSNHARSHPDYSITFNIGILDPGPDDPAVLNRKRFFGPSTMIKHKRESLLHHPLTSVLMGYKWSKFGRFIYYFNFAVYLLLVIVSSMFISEKRRVQILYTSSSSEGQTAFQNAISDDQTSGSFINNVAPLFVTFLVLIQIVKELAQIITLRHKYFLQLGNYVEWVTYICLLTYTTPYWIYLFGGLKIGNQQLWIFATFGIFLLYVNLCLFLQRFSWFGLYITMLIDVLKTVLKVLFVFSLLFFGFAFVFYIMLKEQDSFKTYDRSLMKVMAMTIGELDFTSIMIDTINGTNPDNGAPYLPYPDITAIFMAVFIIVMPIVVMNLLVGLAVGDIDAIQKNAAIEKMAMQVDYVSAVETNYPKFLTRRLFKSEIVFYPNSQKLQSWFSRRLFRYQYGINESVIKVIPEQSSEDDGADNLVVRELSHQKLKMKNLVNLVRNQQRFLEAIASRLQINVEPVFTDEQLDLSLIPDDFQNLLDSSKL